MSVTMLYRLFTLRVRSRIDPSTHRHAVTWMSAPQ